MSSEAITPAEAEAHISTPKEVLDVVNQILKEKWNSSTRVLEVKQETIVEALMKNSILSRDRIFKSGMLNFEDAYRKAGWAVVYNKSSIGDNFDSYFSFSRRN